MAISAISLAITRTPSGRYDLRYPDGVEVSAPDITIGAVPNFTLTEGVSFSQDFAVYVSGTDKPGATYSIVPVIGSLATIDLSFSGSTLSGVTPDVGSFVGRLKVSKSGYDFLSAAAFSVVVNAASATDTEAPTEVFGVRAAVVSGTRIDLTIDWPSDVRTATVDPTDPVKIVVERNVDGGLFSTLTTLTASGSQPSPALSFSAIGAMTAPSGSQSGPDLTISVSDGVLSSSTDSMGFYGGLVSGDFEVACEMPNISSGYAWSISGPCIRQSRTTLSPGAWVAKRTNTNAAGQPMIVRASQGGTLDATADANASAGTPTKIVRAGNVLTYQVWDSTAQNYATVGTKTVVMSDPVEAGAYVCRSTTGAAITVTIPQVRINKLGAATYSDTSVVAGHVYGYRARARDSASPANDSAVGVPTYAATPAPATSIRWHPGHYLFLDGVLRPETLATKLPQFLTRITELAGQTHVKGFKVFIQAASLEGTLGDFSASISLLRQLADHCRQYGKRLWISMLHVQFGGWDPSHLEKYFPAYMLSAPYGTTLMSNGIVMRVWQAATMDRIIAQTTAILNADNGHGVLFKDDPFLECMQIDETSIAVTSGTDGFSNANVATQYTRWMTAARAAAPNMQFRLTANFLSGGTDPDQIFSDLIQTAADLDVGVGGPDTIPNQSLQANRIFTGMVALHPTDHRGVVPWIAEVQSPSMGGTKGDWTAQQLYDWMTIGGLAGGVFQRAVQPPIIVWYDKRWEQGASGGLRSDQPRTSDGSESILTFLNRISGAVYSTACPIGFPSCNVS